MKKIAKSIALICAITTVAAVAFAFTACGAEVTYTYAGCEFNYGSTEIFDTMYKGSTITVSDSKIVWKISDISEVLTVKKDGEKYICSGEYVDRMAQASGATAAGVPFEFYGIKTEDGFDLVQIEDIVEIVFHFVK